MRDEILTTIRQINEARDRVSISLSIPGRPVIKSMIPKDLNDHLAGYARGKKSTRELILQEILALKGSIDEKAIDSFLFDSPNVN